MTENKVPYRNEIPVEYTWNASSVFPSLSDWELEVEKIPGDLQRLRAFQGTLKNIPSTLVDVLQCRDAIFNRVQKVDMFAYISYQVDKTDQTAASMIGKAKTLVGQALAAGSFIEPEILEIGWQIIQEWIQTEPELQIYAHYFDNLFRKQTHIRSAEVEELLGLLADPFAGAEITAGTLTDGDFKFHPAVGSDGQQVEVTQGSLNKIYANPDRMLRHSAWESYTNQFLAFNNTLANNLATSIKQFVFKSNARHHISSLEAALFENSIPVSVFHNMIDTFRRNLPTWHRYFAVRRRILGIEALQPFDMWAPLTTQKHEFSFSQAIEMICQGLEPMGKDYVRVIRKGCLEDRWVDIYPNQGKNAGAFSFGSPGTHPFIVMNYNGEIFSLSTLAHELGHSMHSYLTWQTQPFVYTDYPLFVAEVASNFHQAMVRAYLLDNYPDRDFQISVIEEAMANFYRYFLLMPTLARFELETHQRVERGDGLNAEAMNALMADLFEEAYGDYVTVDRPRVGITWATFGHLFVDYYVFQYATGIAGANALARRILSGVPGAVEDYLSFLKSGASVYPIDALKMAGVDLTSTKPVDDAFQILASYVDRLEDLA